MYSKIKRKDKVGAKEPGVSRDVKDILDLEARDLEMGGREEDRTRSVQEQVNRAIHEKVNVPSLSYLLTSKRLLNCLTFS